MRTISALITAGLTLATLRDNALATSGPAAMFGAAGEVKLLLRVGFVFVLKIVVADVAVPPLASILVVSMRLIQTNDDFATAATQGTSFAQKVVAGLLAGQKALFVDLELFVAPFALQIDAPRLHHDAGGVHAALVPILVLH